MSQVSALLERTSKSLSEPIITSVETLPASLRHDWYSVASAHPNVLFVGDRRATDAAVRDLEATCHHPVAVLDCGNLPVILPSFESVGTLILREVAALPRAEQQVLSDWLSRDNGRTQVVTASSVALFPLVKSGVFQATLYYRLNVVYVEVTASPSTIEPAS